MEVPPWNCQIVSHYQVVTFLCSARKHLFKRSEFFLALAMTFTANADYMCHRNQCRPSYL